MSSALDPARPTTGWLQEAIAGQAEELERLHSKVRGGDDVEAVHDMRVAVRRLRSILRAALPMLEAGWVESVRTELGWIGDQLGAVRDLDVLSQRLHEQARGLSGGDAAVATALLRPLSTERGLAQNSLEEALAGGRFAELLDVLSAAVGDLPLVRADRQPADLAEREFKRLRKRAKPDPQASNAFLHKRRIRVKRARYAAELTESDSKRVRHFVREAKRFQDLLGVHQDAVVARRYLRRLARESGQLDTALVAGRLIELQEGEMRRTRKALPRAWKRLLKRGGRAFST